MSPYVGTATETSAWRSRSLGQGLPFRAALTAIGSRGIVVRSKPEDRKVSGLWHFCLDALKQPAV
jgi:hypothetical protein